MFLFIYFLMKLELKFTDMLNHSFQPNCLLHWRFRDHMLEVLINAGQSIKEKRYCMIYTCVFVYFIHACMHAISTNNIRVFSKPQQMTLNCFNGAMHNMLVERYGFSSPVVLLPNLI
jgi:uncharacterized membrane protein